MPSGVAQDPDQDGAETLRQLRRNRHLPTGGLAPVTMNKNSLVAHRRPSFDVDDPHVANAPGTH